MLWKSRITGPALSMSLVSTMETVSGTLRASTSRVSVDQRNASTQLRPSLWSRADWLDWSRVQNQELTVGSPYWEALKTLTQEAFDLTKSRVHIDSGPSLWGLLCLIYGVYSVCIFKAATWNFPCSRGGGVWTGLNCVVIKLEGNRRLLYVCRVYTDFMN